MRNLIVAAALIASGCGSMPTAPEPIHIDPVSGRCILATKFDGEFYVNYSVLVPEGQEIPKGVTILPDSACIGVRP